MKFLVVVGFALCLVLTGVGCGRGEDHGRAGRDADSPESLPSPAPELVTEESAAERAAIEITAENFEIEAAKLEKELDTGTSPGASGSQARPK